MISEAQIRKDFEAGTAVWGKTVMAGDNALPGFIEDRTDLVETEEGVVERNYKVFVTTAALTAKTQITAGGKTFTVSSSPARDGVYEYPLREVKP